MKVTYNWLLDFVEFKEKPEVLADKLTMAGLEVVNVEKLEDDYVFEIEVTSNRPDWLSVFGIAREVAAITKRRLRLPCLQTKEKRGFKKGSNKVQIKIESKNDCPWYTARVLEGVEVGPSPGWLRRRLELVGCRSINNVVDITNYCLFEFGEPLHAFDYDKLKGQIIYVRRAKDTEKIVTLDGQERRLNRDILVIADREQPVAIAGIMGGKDSEVNENTRTILLEAAIFNPILTRKAKRMLGITTESAYRFERGVEAQTVRLASLRAVELLQELTNAKPVWYGESLKPKKISLRISLDVDQINRTCGLQLRLVEIKDILQSLGFGFQKESAQKFSVSVPSYRQDISSVEDLIEEICRIYGYQIIRPSLFPIKPQSVKPSLRSDISEIKNILVGLGLQEVITYSLISEEMLKDFSWPFDALVTLANPLNSEQRFLRPSLMPSLLKCIGYNINQRNNSLAFFEIAKIFGRLSNRLEEMYSLGIALCGTRMNFTGSGVIKEEYGILHLKGIVESLFKRIGIDSFTWEEGTGVGTFLVKTKDKEIARIFKPGTNILERFDIKNKEVVLAEIDLGEFLMLKKRDKRFTPLPVYPPVVRDVSFLVKEDNSVEKIIAFLYEQKIEFLQEVKLIDYYKGKQIPPGFYSITLSCSYRSQERTLKEEEANLSHAQLCQLLVQDWDVKIR